MMSYLPYNVHSLNKALGFPFYPLNSFNSFIAFRPFPSLIVHDQRTKLTTPPQNRLGNLLVGVTLEGALPKGSLLFAQDYGLPEPFGWAYSTKDKVVRGKHQRNGPVSFDLKAAVVEGFEAAAKSAA
jgi:hypothetical protein